MKNKVQTENVDRLSLEERKLLLLKVNRILGERVSTSGSDKSRQLIAYVTANENFNDKQLKRALRTKVPEYMVPSRIIKVNRFPVLPNGKVDKKALGQMYYNHKELEISGEAMPTSESENKLLSIWKEVLNLTSIGIHDNFFEIGGDSILSIQVIAKARSVGMPLSPNQLFECQTISELAKSVAAKQVEPKKATPTQKLNHVVAIRSKGHKPPLFCLHSGGTHFFFYNLFATFLHPDRPVYALQASPHEGEIILHDSVRDMASDFIREIKEVQPHGPYHFMSYCYNTAIGTEIKKILDGNSESVNLIIADTMADYLSLFAPSRTTKRASAFLRRLKAAPFKTLMVFIRGKIMDSLRERLKTLTSTGSERLFLKLHRNHIKVYGEYEWKPFEGTVQLLLTEKKEPEFNKGVIDSWEKLANGGVKVVPVEGHHDRLFEDQTAEKTAMSVEACMRDFEMAERYT